MENTNYILQKKYKISSLDADFKSEIRVSSLINFFIQIAWSHAEELGWGLNDLAQLGYGWVLSRFKIKIINLPSWPGELSLTTWPKGLNRLFYIRDSEILDKNNNPIAAITSAWIILDKKTKRPKLYKPDSEILTTHKNKHAIEQEIETLKTQGKLISSIPFKVRYFDIDINQHLTTVRYIDYMFDSYSLEYIENNVPREITVNFIKEVKFGDDVVMNRYEDANVHFFELVNTAKNIVSFKAQVKF